MNDVVAYGSWPSPIGAAWLAQAGVSLDCVTSDGDSVCWTEGRPTEGGRYVVVRDGVDITPEGFNVRTRVHEYGGGASVIHRGTLYFVNFADQRLYQQGENEAPCAITPEPERSCSERYADMAVSPDGAWIVCVRERHPEQGQPINELAILPTDGSA